MAGELGRDEGFVEDRVDLVDRVDALFFFADALAILAGVLNSLSVLAKV